MKAAFRLCHKYLALCLGALWLLQALTGMLLVFHRELDDKSLGASGQAVNFAVVDRVLGQLAQGEPATKIVEYFVSGGVAGQVDVLIERAGAAREVVRIDGATGIVLRTSAWEEPRSQLGLFRFVLLAHKQLLAGRFGEWLIGISGVFLLINIVLGLKLAWPRAGQWRAALFPRPAKAPAAKRFAWHRAMGLWLAPFASLVALTGSLMTWTQELPAAATAPLAPATSSAVSARDGRMISSAAAVEVARHLYQDATVAIVSMPSEQRPWYSIRLRQPGELRRIYGATQVRVDADTGEPMATFDALRMSMADKIFVALYPIHSGEWGGVATRLLAILVGVWLAGTMAFGLLLWIARRAREGMRSTQRVGVRSV
ncbi:PepSY-associated TM helix domain-containing protein [Steroidobacter flavus]|uniref:PepSY-associated TM helix domain-containing protein n=1 Tax=Steroidobacter flavus TaxID=1842136 RepID=A0ABV8SYQ5_9GAMM